MIRGETNDIVSTAKTVKLGTGLRKTNLRGPSLKTAAVDKSCKWLSTLAGGFIGEKALALSNIDQYTNSCIGEKTL